jgi:hypothetical protein
VLPGARPSSATASTAVFVVFIVRLQVGDVQKSGLVRSDIYEGSLDSRQDRVDMAQIDVSQQPP